MSLVDMGTIASTAAPACTVFDAPVLAIDVEMLLQWTYAGWRIGLAPYRGDPALSLDGGLTARPRRRPKTTWTEAMACAGMRMTVPRQPLDIRVPIDAVTVADAVRDLAPGLASAVVHHARRRARPVWLGLDVAEARPVWRDVGATRIKLGYGDRRHRHYPFCLVEYTGARESRVLYERWWGAVDSLRDALDGRLERWRINGFAAPREPWHETA